LITDKFKELLADYAVLLLKGGTHTQSAEALNGVTGDTGTITAGTAKVGQGGNSTSPAATALDVDIGAASSAYTITAIKSDDNVVEFSLRIAGSNSNLNGKVIREAGFFDAQNNMLTRLSFDGVGPVSNTSDLEIIFIVEVE
tara:strand:+ start:9382 stop:9807 length:426 start_codon:yes stop_codon:yes gene_type:complete